MSLDNRDNTAELALLGTLDSRSAGEQRAICKTLEVPWEEYLRLKRKWSRVLDRYHAAQGRQNENI